MPQGSVIGPLLFNVTLPSLAKIFLQHALYADDLTLWTAQGLNGNKQDVLQEAADDTTAEPTQRHHSGRHSRRMRLRWSFHRVEWLIIFKEVFLRLLQHENFGLSVPQFSHPLKGENS